MSEIILSGVLVVHKNRKDIKSVEDNIITFTDENWCNVCTSEVSSPLITLLGEFNGESEFRLGD